MGILAGVFVMAINSCEVGNVVALMFLLVLGGIVSGGNTNNKWPP